MSNSLCFAAAFNSHGALDDIRPLSSERSKKRKRDSTPLIADGPSSTISLLDHTQSLTDSGRESLAEEGEASVQPATLGLPRDKFSHASLQTPKHRSLSGSKSAIADELAKLRPPLYFDPRSSLTSTNGRSRSTGMRQQHLAAVTAIMHKCVLEGGYNRASRAWSTLLRAEHNGHSLDLRANDRWGLGAEFLLRRKPQFLQPGSGVEKPVENMETGEQHQPSNTGYNMQNIREVKNYYERLVLQYPFRKASPDATGPQDFYLAMFGLWIFSVQERHCSSVIGNGKNSIRQTETSVNALGESSNAPFDKSDSNRYRQDEVAGHDALESAHEIAARLEELLNSPPYTDNARYWELLGMVNLWIGDLLRVTVTQASVMNTGEDTSSATSDDSGSSTEANNEEVRQSRGSKRFIQRAKAIADAKTAFEKARNCSQGVT